MKRTESEARDRKIWRMFERERVAVKCREIKRSDLLERKWHKKRKRDSRRSEEIQIFGI